MWWQQQQQQTHRLDRVLQERSCTCVSHEKFHFDVLKKWLKSMCGRRVFCVSVIEREESGLCLCVHTSPFNNTSLFINRAEKCTWSFMGWMWWDGIKAFNMTRRLNEEPWWYALRQKPEIYRWWLNAFLAFAVLLSIRMQPETFWLLGNWKLTVTTQTNSLLRLAMLVKCSMWKNQICAV